jgi:hypothetical protein
MFEEDAVIRKTFLAAVLVSSFAMSAPAVAGAAGGPSGGGSSGGGGGASCATLSGTSAPTGLFQGTFAAIWNTFTVKNCTGVAQTLFVEVTDTNLATGAVEWDQLLPFNLTQNQSQGWVSDFDNALYGTSYKVTFTVRDNFNSSVLGTWSTTVTTPPAK